MTTTPGILRLAQLHKIIRVFRFKPFDQTTELGRSQERYRRIVLSSSSSLISKVLTSLIGLISIRLSIEYLGKEQYGLWMVITSLIVFIQIADFGIVNGLTNAIAEAHGRDDREASCSYISSALAATSITSLIFLVPVVLLSLWLPWDIILNFKDPDLLPLARKCFLAAGVVFVVGLPVSIITRVFIGFQLGYISNFLQVLSSICALAGLMMAISFELSMPWLVLLVSAGPVVGNFFSWFLLKRFLPWCQISLQIVNRQAFRRVARSSVPLFFFQIGALVTNQLVNVLIAQVGSLEMVADYNIVLKVYMLIFTVGISLSAPFYPAIREAYERLEKNWIMLSIYRVISIRLVALLLPGFILLLIGDWLISLWVGQPLESRFGLLGWSAFLLSLQFVAISSTLSEILISLDVIWDQIKIVMLSALVVLSGIYYGVPQIGLPGIFLSMTLSTVFPIIWSYYRLKRHLAICC